MKNSKTAFTMIELIFIIVILGILASVALPKLAASKNDATASRIALELGDCIEMACGAYAKTGEFDINSSSCYDVSVSHLCFTLVSSDANGTLHVKHVSGSTDGSVCKKAQKLVRINELSSPDGVTHSF